MGINKHIAFIAGLIGVASLGRVDNIKLKQRTCEYFEMAVGGVVYPINLRCDRIFVSSGLNKKYIILEEEKSLYNERRLENLSHK